MDAASKAQPSLVHVVDDDDRFRTSMMRVLAAAGLDVRGYRCADEFLLCHSDGGSGCILLDVSMPGPSGVDLLKVLAARELAPPVIFVTGHDNFITTVDVMKRGALDYLVKPISAQMILPRVRAALQIDAQRRAAYREQHALRARFEGLTAVERAIFHGVLQNRLNKQLAADLGACERTIKAQRARMFEKLQVTTVPQLVRVARALEEMAPTGSCTRNVAPAWGQLFSALRRPPCALTIEQAMDNPRPSPSGLLV